MAFAIVCSGCAVLPARATSIERHVLPNGLSHVVLEDFEVVSFLDVDLHTAVQTREAVESEFGARYGQTGHLRWFFHAFDDSNLDFIVARYAPKDSTCPRYVAERRLRVRRSPEAEQALGVMYAVRQDDSGRRSVKPVKTGMAKGPVCIP